MEDVSNHSLMKKINRAKVLNAIRTASPVSRSEIAQLTKLDKKSITNFISELASEGIVEEIGKRPAESGRPFTLLSFRRDAQFALGISIEPGQAVGTLVNLYGEAVRQETAEYPLECDLPTLLAGATNVYAALHPKGGRLCGVGVTIPGVTDVESGVVIDSVNIPALKGVNIPERLRQIVREPVYFEEASLAKTLAEKWFGVGRNARTFACIDIGVGVGMGLLYDGRLYRGALGYSGEIGHVRVEANGRRCRCGNLGCLEAYLSEHTILQQLATYEGRAWKTLAEASAAKPESIRTLNDAGYRLGLALSYLMNVLGPMPLVLNGELLRFHELVLPEVLRAVKAHGIRPFTEQTKIQISELRQASALGAAACVLSHIFEVPGHFYA